MTYLATQIGLWIVVAAIVGAVAAWLTRSAAARPETDRLRRRAEELEGERDTLAGELANRTQELEKLSRDRDRTRSESEEAERDLSVIIGERDRALTRAVGLQEEVEALAEAFRERNEAVARLQRKLDAAEGANGAEAELLELRKERDRLKRLLAEKG